MRYLISIEPDYDQINAIDTSGDIMPLLKWLREAFDAEQLFLEAAQRKIWMVAAFENAGDLNKLTCVSLFRLGAAPIFRPIFTEAENQTAIPASLAFMQESS